MPGPRRAAARRARGRQRGGRGGRAPSRRWGYGASVRRAARGAGVAGVSASAATCPAQPSRNTSNTPLAGSRRLVPSIMRNASATLTGRAECRAASGPPKRLFAHTSEPNSACEKRRRAWPTVRVRQPDREVRQNGPRAGCPRHAQNPIQRSPTSHGARQQRVRVGAHLPIL